MKRHPSTIPGTKEWNNALKKEGKAFMKSKYREEINHTMDKFTTNQLEKVLNFCKSIKYR